MTISQISVTDLVTYLNLDVPVQLVDVREPDEVAIACIEGFKNEFRNLPLSQFETWGDRIHTLLDRDTETLVLCHHGVRSMQMCNWLMQQGFTNVKNIAKGIDAYSQLVDNSIPLY